MARGDGSVSKRVRKDGLVVWDVWWVVRDPVTGQRRRVAKKGLKTKSEADAFRRRVVQAAESGQLARPARTRLGDYLDGWVETVRIKPQTRVGYRNKIRLHVVPHIGGLRLDEVTPHRLNQLYQRLEREGSPGGNGPLSPASVRQVHCILSAAFNDGIREGTITVPVAPTARAQPPTERQVKAARTRWTPWSAAQLAEFLRGVENDHYGALWWLYATTGCRRSELLGLRWSDVDLDARTLTLARTVIEDRVNVAPAGEVPRWNRRLSYGPLKSDRGHQISLDAASVALLRRHRTHQSFERNMLGERWKDEDLVFCRGVRWLGKDGHAGGPLDPERISQAFQLRVRDSGLPYLRLHDLRHTWATLALGANIPLKVVQERLGHATSAITADIYSHVTPAMDRAAADTVAALFTGDVIG